MSFAASAQNIRVEGSTLLCTLQNVDGQPVEASLDLNSCVGNDNGTFSWGGQGFADSAESLSFQIDVLGLPILNAQLRNVDGEMCNANLNLSERIGNDNGQLVFDALSMGG